MNKKNIIIASRESPLALAQTESIKQQLMRFHPELSVDILGITTEADKRLDITLTEIGGKGLFVKELEEALLAGRADIAVHSVKDMPMTLPQGLIMPVITAREEPRDVFVSNQYESLQQLPVGSRVGTASLRRQTQLRELRSDLALTNVRGNINTRLARLDHGDYDALILAAAGLKRMHWASRIRSYLSIEESLPAAGQGALGIECRANDENILALISHLNDSATAHCVTAERALCRGLGGGCKLPIAAYAELEQDTLILRGLVANADGSRILRVLYRDDKNLAENLGNRAADDLRQQGADEILREFQNIL